MTDINLKCFQQITTFKLQYLVLKITSKEVKRAVS